MEVLKALRTKQRQSEQELEIYLTVFRTKKYNTQNKDNGGLFIILSLY